MLDTVLGRFRLVGTLEAISYLLLLFVAMPLKYIADQPALVRWVGWAHGVLFVLYLLAALHAAIAHRWSFSRLFLAFFASLAPFGPFDFDRTLRRDEEKAADTMTGAPRG
jgi:integral membrane protein